MHAPLASRRGRTLKSACTLSRLPVTPGASSHPATDALRVKLNCRVDTLCQDSISTTPYEWNGDSSRFSEYLMFGDANHPASRVRYIGPFSPNADSANMPSLRSNIAASSAPAAHGSSLSI